MIERALNPQRPYRRAVAVLASVVTVFSASMVEPAHAKPKPEVTSFQGEIETEDEGNWMIDCYGSKKVRIRPGDTISSLVARHTVVVEAGAIGDKDIPSEVMNNVVAEMNNIEDPDLIFAGKKMTLPKQCQTGTVR